MAPKSELDRQKPGTPLKRRALSGVPAPPSSPKLEKIVLNMGVGDAATDKKKLEAAVKDMTAIAGQKVVITKAKKPMSATIDLDMPSLVAFK